MDGVILTPLKRIHHPKGDIYHALKATEESFDTFGEAYFTTVHLDDAKGWKKHTKMTMNLVVPVGKVCFYIHEEKSGETFSVELGENNYQRLTVNPGIWMAFCGTGKGLNLVLNIASIPHDPNEAINVDLKTFPL